MIKFIPIIITIFISINSFAQSLTITACKYCPTDSTYIISQRYDINGNPCSIVKVFTKDIRGEVKFKGNIIGEVIDNENYYTIYVLNKTKRLNAFHIDYIPCNIDFTQYDDSPMGVEQNKVYYVYIEGQGGDMVATSNIAYPTGSRILSFSSNNKLKKLIVNGVEWQIIDYGAKKLLPYGKYQYEAVDTNEHYLEGEIELLPAIGSKIVNLDFGDN